jgi:hypothetical protein
VILIRDDEFLKIIKIIILIFFIFIFPNNVKNSFKSIVYLLTNSNLYQLLVGSMVIGAELGREDRGSIPRNCNREGVGTT